MTHTDQKPQEKNLRYVKIFGERNTGTHFLTQLVDINTSLKPLKNQSKNVIRPGLKKILASYKESGSKNAATSGLLNSIILNRLLDEQRRNEQDKNFGWKHALVEPQSILNTKRHNNTLFVFLIRNPWRFISALHKRPYNLIPKPSKDIRTFINSSFLANERDNLPSLVIENPVDLWNQKVKSYFKCSTKINNSIICYYEEIVESPQEFIKKLAPFCRINDSTEIPIKSTKSDSRSFHDYQREALTYNPKQALGNEIYQEILQKLDHKILHRTIYTT